MESDGTFYLDDDYFNRPAEMKPLLHTWSLGIEEKFDLIASTLIIVIFEYGRRSLAICFALCLASFLAELMLTTHRSVAFHLLPSRLWELLLGSCVALGMRAGRAYRLKPVSANRAALRFRRTGRQAGMSTPAPCASPSRAGACSAEVVAGSAKENALRSIR
ncbi:hypothetical protein MET9862_04642 [Methylobacterium symbioticum]|uniref:Uncharacterized protein n=1 Tax=Methylobacterium symbioticum TaxID=2584084 RepID=A0A509EIN4_9HYPH|nr:hypothetical protein MET9862_04642 [Methylobacterium symbioticum]